MSSTEVTKDNKICSKDRPVILIAQADTNDLRRIEDAAIECNKFDVITATTGREVVDKINDSNIDIVIIGLKFPDFTGTTLAFIIHEFNPYIKIGFLTNYRSSILVSATHHLNCVFFDKEEEMQNLPDLCEKLYNLAKEKEQEEESRQYDSCETLVIPPIVKEFSGERNRWKVAENLA